MANHAIIVSNVGMVYDGRSKRAAQLCFNTYVDRSKAECGRCGGEGVVWYIGNEIHQEYTGTLTQEDNDNE